MAASQPKSLAVKCPKCWAGFEIGVELAGKQGRCQCGHVFQLPALPEEETASSTPKPKKATEYVGVECRVCQTRMFGRLNQVGQPLKCPDCGALTVLPAPALEKAKDLPKALEGDQYELWDVDAAPSNSALLAAQPQYVVIECNVCRTRLHATVKQVGKRIKCPDCGTVHVVPPPEVLKPKPSVLTADGDDIELEEWTPPPVQQATIIPPRKPMVYEEEREALLARQAERQAQGKTGGPQYDLDGRPIMPKRPLVTRIVPFLWSRGVPVRWGAMSVALFGILALLVTGLSTMFSGAGVVAAGVSVIGGVLLGVGAGLMGMIWFAALASMLVTIITESSEGNDFVQEWPAPSFADWMAYMLTLLIAGAASAFPGWLVGQIAFANLIYRMLAVAVSVWLCFPIVILSQLDIGSMFGIVSGRLLASLAKCPFSWWLYYLETAALAGICVAVIWSEKHLGAAASILAIPVVVAAALLGARILGRLAWKLAESMPAAEAPDPDGQAI